MNVGACLSLKPFISGLLQPFIGFEANSDLTICPFHDRALDGAGVFLHDCGGAVGVMHAVLDGFVELAPGRSLAVEHFFPARSIHPLQQLVFWNTLLFEIMEGVSDCMLIQPVACFLDGIAVRDAKNGGGLAHDVV